MDVVTEVDAQKVTQLEAQVQSQKDGLRNNRLTAPITGTVKSVQIKPGMAVNAAPSALTVGSKPSTAAIVIDSHGSLVAETKVDGSAAADIRVGDPVQLTFARDHTAVRGTVSSVGIASTDQSGKESVPVTVMIPKDPPGFVPRPDRRGGHHSPAKEPRGDGSVCRCTHERRTHLRRRTRQWPECQSRRPRGNCRERRHSDRVGTLRRDQGCGAPLIHQPIGALHEAGAGDGDRAVAKAIEPALRRGTTEEAPSTGRLHQSRLCDRTTGQWVNKPHTPSCDRCR